MIKYQLESHQGTVIGTGEYKRVVKLFTSPNSLIKTEDFALGMTVIRPGQRHEVHGHNSNQEVMIIYDGTGIAVINHVEMPVHKGDVISVGENETHGFINTGECDFKILWIYYPPGIAEEKFLRKE